MASRGAGGVDLYKAIIYGKQEEFLPIIFALCPYSSPAPATYLLLLPPNSPFVSSLGSWTNNGRLVPPLASRVEPERIHPVF